MVSWVLHEYAVIFGEWPDGLHTTRPMVSSNWGPL